VARQGEFPGDEVEHGGHVFHCPIPASFALHSREQAVESLHEGGGQPLGPVGQDAFQMPFDHPGDSGHRFEHLPGLVTHRPHPRAPVAEQLPGFLHILPFIDALKHQPHLVGHARHTPFQGHRLPLLGLLFRPALPVLQPHPVSYQLKYRVK
jgi:hypothetical protein